MITRKSEKNQSPLPRRISHLDGIDHRLEDYKSLVITIPAPKERLITNLVHSHWCGTLHRSGSISTASYEMMTI